MFNRWLYVGEEEKALCSNYTSGENDVDMTLGKSHVVKGNVPEPTFCHT